MTKGRAIQNFLKFINAARSDGDANGNADSSVASTLASTAANTQQKPKTNKINYKRTQTHSYTRAAEDADRQQRRTEGKEHEQKPTMRRATHEVLVLWNHNNNQYQLSSSDGDSDSKGNGAWN